jgi:type I restriction enzyme M protein
MQPLQRSYAINAERIEQLLAAGGIDGFYDYNKVYVWENSDTALSDKDKKKLEQYKKNEANYKKMEDVLHKNMSDTIWYKKSDFENFIKPQLSFLDNKIIEKLIDILSKMDKNAEIQKDKKGNIIYDKSTKDIEIVKYDDTIEDYMAREVLPHVPDAQWFWEEDLNKKTPVVKTGAEIPFTRYFYKYQTPTPSEDLMKKFLDLDMSVRDRMRGLFE